MRSTPGPDRQEHQPTRLSVRGLRSGLLRGVDLDLFPGECVAVIGFPEHAELRQMQDDIHQEQQHYTQQIEDQRSQTALQAQTRKFAVQHRHGAGSSFCTGLITITPDGIAKYDCTTADNGGRCEHVVFAAGALKEVKLKGDGSMHVATHQQGNYDFSGADFAVRDAAAALGPLVKR